MPEGKHRHEWVTGWAQVQRGWAVEVRVESLGQDATPDEVIALVRALPADHKAWRVRPEYGMRDGVTQCIACGRNKA
jgi:hypothetical protein